MTTEKHDPWALLREALPFLETVKSDGVFGADDRASALLARIDAALAEHNTVSPSKESDESKTIWRAYANRELSEDEAKAKLAALEAE